MTVETVDGVLHMKSSREIALSVGGTYMRMTPEGIEYGHPGWRRVQDKWLEEGGSCADGPGWRGIRTGLRAVHDRV
ncbi:DUF2345 domain-containing protein, partial [Paraburkholderia domus]|uniref:DUF2345 domain-containing protein n=1 Tax=Paraburkholderia domus TaxID=2793075 RepID=UPI001F26B5AE